MAGQALAALAALAFCLALAPGAYGFLVSSSISVANYTSVDLSKNLAAYIKHEEIRLGVIRGMEKYEDEIPLVEARIEEFKKLEESIAENKTNTAFWDSLKVNHPTTLFALIRNFMNEFQTKFENHTKYGDRFREFMKKNMSGPLPDKQDLHRVGMALSVIENVYNFSMGDMHKGLIHGHQGEPLSCADMYDIAQTMISDGLLEGATSWIEAAMADVELKDIKKGETTFDVISALTTLGRVAFAKGDHAKCLKYFEKATELEPDDQDLYKEYVSHRFGRNVDRLDELNVEKVEPWRKKFFNLCRQSLDLDDDNLYIVPNKTHPHLHCRYKQGWVPYSRYKEEIINVSPYISIVHNFMSCKEAKTIKADTSNTLDHFVLPGNDRVTLWQFKGDLFKDHEYPNIKKVSQKIGDVTGMKIKQKTKKSEVSFGEPIHIMDYGISGLALPHAEYKKDYHTHYMNIDNGKRYATVMVPLADVLVGGATTFIQQNITIKAKKGMAVILYSWTPAGTREDDMYVATCPLAVGENFMLEKGLWWTIYDKTNYCGKKPTSSHLARQRVIAQHQRLARSQRSKYEPNEDFLKKEIERTKVALEEKWEAERKVKEEELERLRLEEEEDEDEEDKAERLAAEARAREEAEAKAREEQEAREREEQEAREREEAEARERKEAEARAKAEAEAKEREEAEAREREEAEAKAKAEAEAKAKAEEEAKAKAEAEAKAKEEAEAKAKKEAEALAKAEEEAKAKAEAEAKAKEEAEAAAKAKEEADALAKAEAAAIAEEEAKLEAALKEKQEAEAKESEAPVEAEQEEASEEEASEEEEASAEEGEEEEESAEEGEAAPEEDDTKANEEAEAKAKAEAEAKAKAEAEAKAKAEAEAKAKAEAEAKAKKEAEAKAKKEADAKAKKPAAAKGKKPAAGKAKKEAKAKDADDGKKEKKEKTTKELKDKMAQKKEAAAKKERLAKKEQEEEGFPKLDLGEEIKEEKPKKAAKGKGKKKAKPAGKK